MRNYWLDRADLCVKESHFELDERLGLVLKSELSNGKDMMSWVDRDGILNSIYDLAWDYTSSYSAILEYELQEKLAEEKFGTMAEHIHTDAPNPLEGSFTFYAGEQNFVAPKVEIVVADDVGCAIKFLHKSRFSMEDLIGSVGVVCLMCELGIIKRESVYLWSREPINGYYLFVRK